MKRIQKGFVISLACWLMLGFMPMGVYAQETAETVETTVETDPPASEAWAIDEKNFPDEHFRDYVLASFDKDQNGTLSQPEADEVTQINVSGMEIASVQGVEYFRSLTKLDCSKNLLTELYLNGMGELQELYCHDNQLEELTLGECTALEVLYCSQNQLAALNLSDSCRLTTLLCQDNLLQALDVSVCPDLEFLFCSNNSLAFLDVSSNPKLLDVQVRGNAAQRPELLVSRSLDWTTLPGFDAARSSGWKNAVLSGDLLLADEYAASVTFTYDIDGELGAETAVFTWVIPKPDGIAVDETNFPDDYFRLLVSLEVDTQQDRMLTPEEIAAATVLDANEWNIESLRGIEFLTELERLTCSGNALPFLDVSALPKLAELEVEGNAAVMAAGPARTLDLTGLDGFNAERASDWSGATLAGRFLTVDEQTDQVTFTYDVDGGAGERTAAFTWYVTFNEIQETAIDEKNFPDDNFRAYILDVVDENGDGKLSYRETEEVTRLYLEDRSIASLDGIVQFTRLRELYCGFNQLASLDLRGCTELATLNCDGNGLTELLLPEGDALTVLSCNRNRISSLDIHACPNLTWLFCNQNRLTSLDISENGNLEKLSWDGNRLSQPEETVSGEGGGEEPSGEPVPQEEPEKAADCGMAHHQFAQWSPTVLSTCNTEGVLAHSTCTVCGKFFDAGGKELTDLTIPVAPDRHGNTESVPAVRPTCTEEGYTAGVYCNDCGKYLSGHVPIPAAHQLGAWDRGVPATQTSPGVKAHADCVVCHKHFDKEGRELTDLTIPAMHDVR